VKKITPRQQNQGARKAVGTGTGGCASDSNVAEHLSARRSRPMQALPGISRQNRSSFVAPKLLKEPAPTECNSDRDLPKPKPRQYEDDSAEEGACPNRASRSPVILVRYSQIILWRILGSALPTPILLQASSKPPDAPGTAERNRSCCGPHRKGSGRTGGEDAENYQRSTERVERAELIEAVREGTAPAESDFHRATRTHSKYPNHRSVPTGSKMVAMLF
jgi:hypothetical protein